MALLDKKNGVIYWNGVNWKNLPYVQDLNSFVMFSTPKYQKVLSGFDHLVEIYTSMGFTLKLYYDLKFREGNLSEPKRNVFKIGYNTYVRSRAPQPYFDDEGFAYLDNKHFCEYNGFPSFKRFVQSGLTLKEYKEKHYKRLTPKQLTYKGVQYKNGEALAKRLGISKNSFYDWLKQGLSYDEMAERKANFRSHSSLWFAMREVGLETIADWDKMPTTLKYRYAQRLNKSIDRGIPPKIIAKFILEDKYSPIQDHEGSWYPTVEAMYQHWGVSRAVVSSRFKRGATLEGALTGNFKVKKKKG